MPTTTKKINEITFTIAKGQSSQKIKLEDLDDQNQEVKSACHELKNLGINKVKLSADFARPDCEEYIYGKGTGIHFKPSGATLKIFNCDFSNFYNFYGKELPPLATVLEQSVEEFKNSLTKFKIKLEKELKKGTKPKFNIGNLNETIRKKYKFDQLPEQTVKS